jgi:hypothetical protein
MNSAMWHDRKLASFLTIVTLLVTLSIQIAQGQNSSAIKIPTSGSFTDGKGNTFAFTTVTVSVTNNGKVVGMFGLASGQPKEYYPGGMTPEELMQALKAHQTSTSASAPASTGNTGTPALSPAASSITTQKEAVSNPVKENPDGSLTVLRDSGMQITFSASLSACRTFRVILPRPNLFWNTPREEKPYCKC